GPFQGALKLENLCADKSAFCPFAGSPTVKCLYGSLCRISNGGFHRQPCVQDYMHKRFDVLAKEFAETADKYQASQNMREQKELLMIMRLILSEVDRLSLSQLKDYPIPGSADYGS